MVTKNKIKCIVEEYVEKEEMRPIHEIGDGYGDSIKRELRARLEKDREEGLEDSHYDEDDDYVKTDPIKGVVSPSKKVVTNICRREQICDEQGEITFGQLERLIKTSHRKRLGTDIGEGVYKSFIRLLPWFIPQIAIGAFVGSAMRAINKVVKPALESTKGYKTWWGSTVLNVMNLAEGELPTGDPFSKIFFISDGLLEMLGDKYKYKFARYISEIAASKSPNEVVPEYFVENELRNYLNQKFLLDPPLQLKESVEFVNEGFKEVVLTLGLLLGGNMAVSQTNAEQLLSNPKPDTIETINTILANEPLFKDYMDDVKDYGTIDTPKFEFVDDWIKYKGLEFQIKPPIVNRGKLLVGVRFPF
jgi:hypothetical protein